jgi:hypothetical protein
MEWLVNHDFLCDYVVRKASYPRTIQKIEGPIIKIINRIVIPQLQLLALFFKRYLGHKVASISQLLVTKVIQHV